MGITDELLTLVSRPSLVLSTYKAHRYPISLSHTRSPIRRRVSTPQDVNLGNTDNNSL